MRSKTVLILFIVFCVANAANAEVKIDSVSQTVGVIGKNMEVTLTGTGFTENTKVSMYIDSGNRKAIIGSVDTPGEANDVKVVDGKAYVADGDGLQIIDVSDPKNPKIIGTADTPGSAEDVYVSGNYAYIAAGYNGFQIIDVSNPNSPQITGGVKTPGGACGVYVSGNYAYIADGDSGLQIIDVSNPSNPKRIGDGADTPDFACGVYVSGNYAYIRESETARILRILLVVCMCPAITHT
jgi:hypothetical protein